MSTEKRSGWTKRLIFQLVHRKAVWVERVRGEYVKRVREKREYVKRVREENE